MDKQTPTQLFLSIFLRVAVVVLGIVICVFGIYFLTRYVKNGKGDEEKPVATVDENVISEVETHDDLLMNTTETTEKASTTDAATTETPAVNDSKKLNILVLNSTEQAGLAGGWCATLNEKGYENTTASDYSNPLSTTKIVAKKKDAGKDLVDYFKGAAYEVGTVDEGVSFDTSDYDVIIILGTDQMTETPSDDSDNDYDDSDNGYDDSDNGYDDSDNGDDDYDDSDDYSDDEG